jgi:hypothetical protein
MRRRGRGPINKRTARLSALLRGHAPGSLPTRSGPRFLESPDANGRTLSGTSAASTSQSGTRRTGRCPNRLKAKSDELRPQEPHPLRQSASPVDVPYDERGGRRYSNPQPPSKAFGFMQTNRGVALSDCRCAQARTRFTPFSKIRKSEVVPVKQGFLSFCESLRGCTAACEFA